MKYEIANKLEQKKETIILDVEASSLTNGTIGFMWTGKRVNGDYYGNSSYIIAELNPERNEVKFNIAGCMSLGLKIHERTTL